MIDPVLEDVWKELRSIYNKGYDFLNEEDMRCLFYHLCAKRSDDFKYIHAQKLKEGTRKKYDLIIDDSRNKHKIAIELKCWLWKSSGTKNIINIIKQQLERLDEAVKTEGYDLAYLFVLDEFGRISDEYGFKNVKPSIENVWFKFISPSCKKEHERWRLDENSQECKECENQMPCKNSQKHIRNWQNKGYMK